MKTAIITTQWLGTEDYIQKSVKFYKYYTQTQVQEWLGNPDIWVCDNASKSTDTDNLFTYLSDPIASKLKFKWFHKHYTRTAHLEYPYCWRALYFARELFQEYDYDKVIFMNNDSFIISQNYMEYIKNFKSGYIVPWCPKHGFPECEIQIITKDSQKYWEMTRKPYLNYNGQHMEDIIPGTVEKQWIGDRHSENGIMLQQPDWDFSTQVRLKTIITPSPRIVGV